MEILTCLALKSLLQVTPEILEDENECLRITNESKNIKHYILGPILIFRIAHYHFISVPFINAVKH